MARSLSNSICRCCSSEGTFKDVNSKYHWMGEEEIYADMLKDCFNISLFLEDCEDRGICEVCITQLRNASNFKKQVLHTEHQFLKTITKKSYGYVKGNSYIKTEGPKSEEIEELFNEDSDQFADDDLDDPDFVSEVKEEEEEFIEIKSKVKKRVLKPATIKSKKVKTASGETTQWLKNRPKIDKGKILHTVKYSSNFDIVKPILLNLKKEKIQNIFKTQHGYVKEALLNKHLANIKQILMYSNATPVRGVGDVGYICWWCSDQFPNPNDLKSHTIHTHIERDKFKFIWKDINTFVVKLDVTDLKCSLCNEEIESPEQLLQHLEVEHEKEVFSDIERRIFPFKFDSDTTGCFYCGMEFKKFEELQEHMNVHFRNFICVVCDSGFVNVKTLLRHALVHDRGKFKCKLCTNTYSTDYNLRCHVCYEHPCNMNYRCKHCDVMFSNYAQYQFHLVDNHGVQLKTACEVCREEFSSQNELIQHLKLCPDASKKYICTQFRIKDKTKIPTPITCQCDAANKSSKIREVIKHVENLKEILRNSNATPIHQNLGAGYVCCYCEDSYLDARDLKSHTIECHDPDRDWKKFKNVSEIYSFLIKLDVTSLKCKLCEKEIDSLEDLANHLEEQHNVPFHKDLKCYIVTFKFDDDLLQCVECPSVFNNFKSLLQHTCSHSRNFVCEICGTGSVNKMRYRTHLARHKTGSFKCDSCDKIFNSLMMKKTHEKRVHLRTASYRCGFCDMKFLDYDKKLSHVKQRHGVENKDLECQSCGKKFHKSSVLTAHIKRHHLMQRSHVCHYCDKSYFKASDLKNHMDKHLVDRKFKCETCSKGFVSKKRLTQHLKVHMKDRQFKCEHCEFASNHKNSWKNHLLVKHNVLRN